MRICTAVMKNNHARSLCSCSEGFYTDVDADWSIGYWRSGCTDPWIGYGHALGSLGERFRRHVPSRVVHVGYVCGNSCLLCRHSRLPHITEIDNKRCRQMVENQWRRIFACIRFVLVRIWNVSSRNHAQSSASHRRNSRPNPHTTRSQKQAEQYGPNLSKG